MNERIHKIARQTGYTWHVTGNPQMVAYYEFAPEKLEEFAELIVRETVKQMAIQMDEFGDDQSNNPAWYKSEEAVKKHFGVEE